MKPVWQDLAKFRRFSKNLEIFGNIWKVYVDNWQSCEPTLGLFVCFWAKLHRCKWPNIEKLASHLVTLIMELAFSENQKRSYSFLLHFCCVHFHRRGRKIRTPDVTIQGRSILGSQKYVLKERQYWVWDTLDVVGPLYLMKKSMNESSWVDPA